MARYRTITWLCLLAACDFIHAGEVTVTQKQWADKNRGPDMMRGQVKLAFPDGGITYQALWRKGESEATIKKYGDHQFGLSFGGGWNWSTYKFMSVQVRAGGKTFDGTARYLMGEARVLENKDRAVAQMTWPLATGEPAGHAAGELDTATAIPELRLRIAQYPSHARWLFMRLSVHGRADLQGIRFTSYPFSSTGPNYRIRERWVTTRGKSARLGDWKNRIAINVNDGGMVLHNKCAQTTRGCFVVFDPADFTACDLAGTYGVETRLMIKQGTREVTLAIGYFYDESYEHAARMFIAETRDQIAQFMAGIDWSAQYEFPSLEPLAELVRELLRRRNTSFWPELAIGSAPVRKDVAEQSEGLRRLRDQVDMYRKAAAREDIDHAMRIFEAMRQTKLRLIREALAELE